MGAVQSRNALRTVSYPRIPRIHALGVSKGIIPVDTCKGYQLQVASYTEGKGVFSTKLHGYNQYQLDDVKVREKTMVDPLNKKLYLIHKMNTVK